MHGGVDLVPGIPVHEDIGQHAQAEAIHWHAQQRVTPDEDHMRVALDSLDRYHAGSAQGAEGEIHARDPVVLVGNKRKKHPDTPIGQKARVRHEKSPVLPHASPELPQATVCLLLEALQIRDIQVAFVKLWQTHRTLANNLRREARPLSMAGLCEGLHPLLGEPPFRLQLPDQGFGVLRVLHHEMHELVGSEAAVAVGVDLRAGLCQPLLLP
mmetsp:Transcript_77068/g.235856  ORF Transcript_77068/g.235856 Transcript_77068/m.235856 type:complete len:212 (-) Transcript_77068:466-1101(-)